MSVLKFEAPDLEMPLTFQTQIYRKHTPSLLCVAVGAEFALSAHQGMVHPKSAERPPIMVGQLWQSQTRAKQGIVLRNGRY